MATGQVAKSPSIREVLRSEGRSIRWLAGRTGYSPEYISKCDSGEFPGAARFWILMESVLGQPVRRPKKKAA